MPIVRPYEETLPRSSPARQAVLAAGSIEEAILVLKELGWFLPAVTPILDMVAVVRNTILDTPETIDVLAQIPHTYETARGQQIIGLVTDKPDTSTTGYFAVNANRHLSPQEMTKIHASDVGWQLLYHNPSFQLKWDLESGHLHAATPVLQTPCVNQEFVKAAVRKDSSSLLVVPTNRYISNDLFLWSTGELFRSEEYHSRMICEPLTDRIDAVDMLDTPETQASAMKFLFAAHTPTLPYLQKRGIDPASWLKKLHPTENFDGITSYHAFHLLHASLEEVPHIDLFSEGEASL